MNVVNPAGGFANIEPGLRVRYLEMGEGPPVIFIHGSAPGASAWSNFKGSFAEFAGAGFRAIGLDLIGYGDSDKPANARYTLDFHVKALKALVDTLGQSPVSIVGNSLGGAIAMRFALDRPDQVKKLVLVAPGGLASKLRYIRMSGIRAMMWSLLGPGGPTAGKLRKTFNLQVFDKTLITDELIEERLAIAKTQPREVLSTLSIDNLLPRLHEIKCPTLAFWGVYDNFCPIETAALLGQGIPDCRVLLLSQCGHWAQVEHRQTFNEEAIRFLLSE
jgi:4,5:9,10-diseco-3-hydroxy-5,9,17-trioxoandrosta-1(10),2-diene-4-oate hydrolase